MTGRGGGSAALTGPPPRPLPSASPAPAIRHPRTRYSASRKSRSLSSYSVQSVRADRPEAPEPLAHTSVERGGHHVLVSSVSSDSHTWNLVFLQLLLEEMGHEVTNIGSCVPDDLLIEECRLPQAGAGRHQQRQRTRRARRRPSGPPPARRTGPARSADRHRRQAGGARRRSGHLRAGVDVRRVRRRLRGRGRSRRVPPLSHPGPRQALTAVGAR